MWFWSNGTLARANHYAKNLCLSKPKGKPLSTYYVENAMAHEPMSKGLAVHLSFRTRLIAQVVLHRFSSSCELMAHSTKIQTAVLGRSLIFIWETNKRAF